MPRNSRDVIDDVVPSQEHSPSSLPQYLQFMELLNANYMLQHNTEFYATQLHISERMLSDACKQVVGITAKTVIEAKLVAESMLLLQQTAFNIEAVARAMGFPDADQFTRFFIRHSGISPSAYRIREQSDAIEDYASIRSSSLN